jgi:hypothetical protein
MCYVLEVDAAALPVARQRHEMPQQGGESPGAHQLLQQPVAGRPAGNNSSYF